MSGSAVIAVLLSAGAPLCAGADLGRIYKATLEHESRLRGHDWTTGEDHVWLLERFEFSYGRELAIRLGESDAVFGVSGTNVVWAAVLPRAPGEIIAAPAGKGENVASIFLRFHPALVRQLFPPSIVIGKGTLEPLIRARRIYQYKIGASWQADQMPAIPPRNALVIDCDTTKMERRFFLLDTQKKSVTAEPSFLDKPVPPLAYGVFADSSPVAVFDQVWEAFDREYAMFTVKPQVDWRALRDRYRPFAEKLTGRYDAAAVLAMLLAHLQDLHVSSPRRRSTASVATATDHITTISASRRRARSSRADRGRTRSRSSSSAASGR